jgi:hypothetical protein
MAGRRSKARRRIWRCAIAASMPLPSSASPWRSELNLRSGMALILVIFRWWSKTPVASDIAMPPTVHWQASNSRAMLYLQLQRPCGLSLGTYTWGCVDSPSVPTSSRWSHHLQAHRAIGNSQTEHQEFRGFLLPKRAAAVAQRRSPLLFNVEINFRRGAVFDYFLADRFHLQFRYSCPLHAPNGLCGFRNCVFRRLRKALFRSSDYFDHLLRHYGSSYGFSFELYVGILETLLGEASAHGAFRLQPLLVRYRLSCIP